MPDPDEHQNPVLDYVELKVTTEENFQNVKTLVPWWCQSIVSGTPLIVCGIRDKDGHVKKIEQVRTDDIPDRVGRGNLDKERYLLFLNDVLTWMKDVVRKEDVVAEFQYAPGSSVPR
ncbi:decapping endonuclease targeting mRNA [Desmophyllum pertusum]|uniref:Decapping nuclease n=1 Tax=Desmophyllum pertusum TaxID=174260 RepID=A0A9X0D286_9CNID|nr:decapping endonuclease targeting mRNA [Desmophyllum pertusum]